MDDEPMSHLKGVLLKAWRERWPPKQWTAFVRQALTRANKRIDRKDQADMVLSEAVVGTVPNNLMFSYLKYAVHTQVIPVPALVDAILLRSDQDKLHCIKHILEVLQNVLTDRLLCPKMSGESQCTASQLCDSLCRVVFWVCRILQTSLIKIQEQQVPMEHQSIVEQGCKLLTLLLNRDPNKMAIQVALLSDPENARARLTQHQTNLAGRGRATQLFPDVRQRLDAVVLLLHGLTNATERSTTTRGDGFRANASSYSQCTVLTQSLVLRASLDPTCEVDELVQHVLVSKHALRLDWVSVYCELLRGSLLGLIEVATSLPALDLQWTAFCFVKLPIVLSYLRLKSGCQQNTDLVLAWERLISFGPMLDRCDKATGCDTVKYLLVELVKKNLITEPQKAKLLLFRGQESLTKIDEKAPQNQHQKNIALILHAEPTVSQILMTLEADYSQKFDTPLGVLSHLMQAKSLELILVAAAASGKLRQLTTKLIEFNELSKTSPGEGGKAAQTRAMLFDISFLMTVQIVQKYGIKIISSAEGDESFLSHWVRSRLPRGDGRPCLQEAPTDGLKVDGLLQQIHRDRELKFSLAKWHEICVTSPQALRELIHAWHAGVITQEHIRAIVAGIQSQMCSVVVCLVVGLSQYMVTIEGPLRDKCRLVIEQLCVAPINVDGPSFPERCALLTTILHGLPVQLSSESRELNVPIHTSFKESMSKCRRLGWISLRSASQYRDLVRISGVSWVVHTCIQELQKLHRQEEPQRAVHAMVAMFMIDIETFASTLLSEALPRYLLHPSLTEKSGQFSRSAVASLVALCLVSASGLPTDSPGSDPAALTPGTNLYPALVRLFELFSDVLSGKYGDSQAADFVYLVVKEMLSAGPAVTKYFRVIADSELAKDFLNHLPPELTLELFQSHPYLFQSLGSERAADIICSKVKVKTS